MPPPTGEILSYASVERPDTARMPTWRWSLTLAAILCGIGLLIATQWSIVSRNRRTIVFLEWRRLIIIGWALALALIAAIPLFHRFLFGIIQRLRSVTPVGRRW